jgi:hypothetical protein
VEKTVRLGLLAPLRQGSRYATRNGLRTRQVAQICYRLAESDSTVRIEHTLDR